MPIVVMVLVVFAMLSGNAAAASLINTKCQKNEGDGRILVGDDRVLPHEDSTFKVLRYKATSRDGDWSQGPCTIRVTGRAR